MADSEGGPITAEQAQTPTNHNPARSTPTNHNPPRSAKKRKLSNESEDTAREMNLNDRMKNNSVNSNNTSAMESQVTDAIKQEISRVSMSFISKVSG